MKSDPTLSSIVNFLLPIIFLYGCFFFVGFFDAGFFAFIYSLVLFSSALMVFYIANADLKMFSKINFENIALFLLLISISYIAALFLFITDFFKI